MTVADLLDIAANAGGVGFWVLATFALWHGWLVPGPTYRRDLARERRRLQFWQKTAWVALGLAKQNAPDLPDFDFEPLIQAEHDL